MKKIFIFFAIVIIIVCIIGIKYYSYNVEYNITIQENSEFEQYKDKEVYGIDVATIINKAVDKNTKNKIEKDEQGIYIQNDTNSIEVEIYTSLDDETHKMEAIDSQGTEQFMYLFSNIKFKCSKIEYHQKTKKIKYILFEQIN